MIHEVFPVQGVTGRNFGLGQWKFRGKGQRLPLEKEGPEINPTERVALNLRLEVISSQVLSQAIVAHWVCLGFCGSPGTTTAP